MKAPTQKQFNGALNVYNVSAPLLQKLQSDRAAAIAKAGAKFDEKIKEAEAEIKDAKATITAYATNKKRFFDFAGGKAYKLGQVSVGYRMPAPSLQPCEGITWDEALALVKEKLPECIRTKEELNKLLLKAYAVSDDFSEEVRACELELVQEEQLFIEIYLG